MAGRARSRVEHPVLPLPLPVPPARAGGISPELSTPCAEPFDAAGWRFCVDWDGVRALLFAEPDGTARLQGSRLQDLTEVFPEVAGEAASALHGRAAVLDGVITLLDAEGRPDLAGLSARLGPGRFAGPGPPAVYLASDLLHLDGAPTMGSPLERRISLLEDLPQPSAYLQVPQWVPHDGCDLAEAARARGLSAVLARRDLAPYMPGVHSPDRLRVDLAGRVEAAVVGVVQAAPRRAAATTLLLAEYVAGRLVPAGSARGGADAAGWMARRTRALRVMEPALGLRTRPGVVWLRPALVAVVRHAGRDASGVLREAEVIALRDDADPAACVRRDPVPPPADVVPAAFRPTVITALPF